MVVKKVMNLVEQLYAKEANLRSEAILALGEMRHSDSVDVLVHVLKTEDDINVLEDACWALVRLGDVAVPPLLELLNDEHPSIRHNAVHTLGKMKALDAVDALINSLNDYDETVRAKAAFALGQISDAKAIAPLINQLSDESLTVRVAVADTLESFGESVVCNLIPLLKDKDWNLRDTIAELLGRIGTADCIEPLITALDDEMWMVRFTVVNALRDAGDVRAIEALKKLLADENPKVVAMTELTLSILSEK